MKAFLVVCAAALLVSCTGTTGQAVQSLGVSEGENAMACIKGGANTNATVVNGAVNGVSVELPDSLDMSDWSPEQIEAVIEALCNNI